MTGQSPLERRYRRWLAFYPETFRAAHEQEMVEVLMQGASPEQTRPKAAEVADLATHGLRANLDLTGGAIMAEAIMMALAGTVGRQHAHEIVHHAAAIAATTGGRFTEVIAQDEAITSRLTPGEVLALLNPATHTGHSATIARLTADRTRRQMTSRAS